MKNVKSIFAGIMLIIAIAIPSFAGDNLPDTSNWTAYSTDADGTVTKIAPISMDNKQSTSVVISSLHGGSTTQDKGTSQATSILVTQLNGSQLANIASALDALQQVNVSFNQPSNGNSLFSPITIPTTTSPTNFTISPANL